MCDEAGNSRQEKLKLEVTLAGPDGRDRKFTVDIKFEMKISLYELLASIEGRARDVPEDAAFALDVALRHLPSMLYGACCQAGFAARINPLAPHHGQFPPPFVFEFQWHPRV